MPNTTWGIYIHVGQGGLPQDFVQAHMWYNLAAAQGVDNARKLRDHVSSLMSPEQVAALPNNLPANGNVYP